MRLRFVNGMLSNHTASNHTITHQFFCSWAVEPSNEEGGGYSHFEPSPPVLSIRVQIKIRRREGFELQIKTQRMTTEVDCEREPPCESMDDGADACVADEDAVCEPDPEASHAVAASAEENARKLAAQQARFVALCADDSLKVNNGEGISAGEVFEEMDRAGKSMLGCNILKTTDCYADAANIEEINMGKSLFYFSLKNADLMSVEEKRLIDCIVNLTTFRDETVEVGVPIVDVFDDADAAKYATILSKTAYLLPGVHLSQLTPPTHQQHGLSVAVHTERHSSME